jgi:hypothetical protein
MLLNPRFSPKKEEEGKKLEKRMRLRINVTAYSRSLRTKIPSKLPKLNQIPKPRFHQSPNDLQQSSGLPSVLDHPTVIIGRQVEMMNIFLGYEQGNYIFIFSK